MSSFAKALRYLDRKVSRAIRDFGLLAGGDRVLVGLSGGKDSLVLLHVLAARRSWRPQKYELVACHVEGAPYSAGGCASFSDLAGQCHALDVPLLRVRGEPGPPLKPNGRPSPCFLCSWRRRKALLLAAQEQACNLVALGHHKDDIAETFLLNLLWQGRRETMQPRQPLFEGRFSLIRPLAYVDEKEIVRVARLGDLPANSCTCPYGEASKRQVAKAIITAARRSGCHAVTNNLLRAGLFVAGDGPAGHPRGRPW